MKIYLGGDHGGFVQKQYLLEHLQGAGFEVEDCGNTMLQPDDDYPDYAFVVADLVARDWWNQVEALGILLCRSGQGMQIAANKLAGIRAVVAWTGQIAREARGDNNANVLSLPADQLSNEEALAISLEFIRTPFSGEARHQRRIEKILTIEHHHHAS